MPKWDLGLKSTAYTSSLGKTEDTTDPSRRGTCPSLICLRHLHRRHIITRDFTEGRDLDREDLEDQDRGILGRTENPEGRDTCRRRLSIISPDTCRRLATKRGF